MYEPILSGAAVTAARGSPFARLGARTAAQRRLAGVGAEAAPREVARGQGRVGLRDGRAVREPRPGGDLRHARQGHAQQVGEALGQTGVLRDAVADRVAELCLERVDAMTHPRVAGEVGLEDEAEGLALVADELEEGRDRRVDPLLVVVGAVEGLEDEALEAVALALQEREVELELAGEVLVEDGLGDPRLVGDVLHRGGVVALAHEDGLGGLQELGSALRARQPLHPVGRAGHGSSRV